MPNETRHCYTLVKALLHTVTHCNIPSEASFDMMWSFLEGHVKALAAEGSRFQHLAHLLKALVLSLKTSGNNLRDFASPEEGLVHLFDFAPLLQNLGPGRKLRHVFD
mmetsp:Transcript_39746/g.33553  ORF Transcript_39746/g.33553 Transcript_39746/m.33553 type:complete len:107 (-) Transcript_39746:1364-1684(-)